MGSAMILGPSKESSRICGKPTWQHPLVTASGPVHKSLVRIDSVLYSEAAQGKSITESSGTGRGLEGSTTEYSGRLPKSRPTREDNSNDLSCEWGQAAGSH